MENKWFYNPFERIAGTQALSVGLSVMGLTIWLSYFSGAHFYGFLNTDFATSSPYWIYLFEQSVHAGLIILLAFLAGICWSKSKIRLVDVAGVVLLARVPLLLVPVFRIIPALQGFTMMSTVFFVHVVLFILVNIWVVTLTYHGYRIACNVKKSALVPSFIGILVLAEAGTKTLIYLFTN